MPTDLAAAISPGKRALRAFVRMFTTALPDFRFDTELRAGQDGLVMAYGHASAPCAATRGHRARPREGTVPGLLFSSPAAGQSH